MPAQFKTDAVYRVENRIVSAILHTHIPDGQQRFITFKVRSLCFVISHIVTSVLQSGIKSVPQAVSHQVQRQYRQNNGQSRENYNVRGIEHKVFSF